MKNQNNEKNGQLLSIQYLRAFAAISVIFHHAREQFPGFEAIFPSNIGSAGVDIFFTISGFIMVFITATGDRSAPRFIWNRILRIVPLYWLYTIMTALLYLIASGLFRSNGLSFEHLILSLLFIPHQNPGDPLTLSPLVKLGWTLNYEMFFYVVFAISMFVNYSKRVLFTFLFLLLLALIGACQFAWIPMAAQFYFADIILEFAAGMLLCQIYKLGKLQPIIFIEVSLITLIVFVMLINTSPEVLNFRSFRFGIPAALIVAGMLTFEKYLSKSKLLLLIGNASYSIYLSHIMVIALLRYLYPRLGLPTAGLFSTLVFVSISIFMGSLGGIISYFLIEKPLIKLSRSISKFKREN
jgi:exopolysaccharide production protein ExoZ